jgi:TRAP-type mannitol/chloroaromatic compound transport system substrate-binding protein
MDRRDFLKTTGGLAALTAGCASTAVAMPAAAAGPGLSQRRLTVAMPWTANHAGLADDAHRLAIRIQTALGDSIALDMRPDIGPRADITIAPVCADTALHPAFAYFGGLPGSHSLLPIELEGWLITGGGQDLWDDLAAPHGFKPLLAGHTGSSPILWSKSPLSAPEDLSGLKVVARGLDRDVLRALGAIPVLGDEQALEAALNDSEVSAVIWGSPVHASAVGIPARFPFGLAGALGQSGGALAVKVDLAVWENFTPAKQSAVQAALSAEFRAALADADITRPAVEHAIAARDGAVIKIPNATFAAAVSRIAAAVVAHTAAHDPIAAQIDRSYSAFKRAVHPNSINVS